MSSEISSSQVHCSFCGKHVDAVKKLVLGYDKMRNIHVCMCDECIELCGQILREELRELSI